MWWFVFAGHLPFLSEGVMTLGQTATVDHLTSPSGIPRGNHSKSSLVYLGYQGRLRVSIRVPQRAIAMVTVTGTGYYVWLLSIV